MRTFFIWRFGILSACRFILYFTAVSTFTTWVMGILQAAELHEGKPRPFLQVREFLEYPNRSGSGWDGDSKTMPTN